MTAAEFELWEGLRRAVERLQLEVATLRESVAGCQAASRARLELARSRPPVLTAAAAWAAFALTVLLNLLR